MTHYTNIIKIYIFSVTFHDFSSEDMRWSTFQVISTWANQDICCFRVTLSKFQLESDWRWSLVQPDEFPDFPSSPFLHTHKTSDMNHSSGTKEKFCSHGLGGKNPTKQSSGYFRANLSLQEERLDW